MQEWKLIGKDWTLFIEQNEVRVIANQMLAQESEQYQDSYAESEFREDRADDDNFSDNDELSNYDEESESWCGIEDFEAVLVSWLEFTA